MQGKTVVWSQSSALIAVAIGIGAMLGRLTWNGWPTSGDDWMAMLTVGIMTIGFVLVVRLAARRFLP